MSSTRYCEHCGASVALSDAFCGKCGARQQPIENQSARTTDLGAERRAADAGLIAARLGALGRLMPGLFEIPSDQRQLDNHAVMQIMHRSVVRAIEQLVPATLRGDGFVVASSTLVAQPGRARIRATITLDGEQVLTQDFECHLTAGSPRAGLVPTGGPSLFVERDAPDARVKRVQSPMRTGPSAGGATQGAGDEPREAASRAESIGMTDARSLDSAMPSLKSKQGPSAEQINLTRYHDLSNRLAVWRVGGSLVRGSGDDLRLNDEADIELQKQEQEVARIAGVTRIYGLVPSASGGSQATMAQVMEAAATLVITTHRLVVMAIGGKSWLGAIRHGEEVHTFVWLWDLTDEIGMPQKRSIGDRLAGGKTIEIFGGRTMTTIKFIPKLREVNGGSAKADEDEVFALLARTGAKHRLSVSPVSDRQRLQEIIAGHFVIDDGTVHAWLTPPESHGLPPHLVGRVIGPEGDIVA